MYQEYAPDGNIGVNVGFYGGQTVPQLHIYLIPRYKGDIEDTRGGIRKAIRIWWSIRRGESCKAI